MSSKGSGKGTLSDASSDSEEPYTPKRDVLPGIPEVFNTADEKTFHVMTDVVKALLKMSPYRREQEFEKIGKQLEARPGAINSSHETMPGRRFVANVLGKNTLDKYLKTPIRKAAESDIMEPTAKKRARGSQSL
jgi:hypothetical protein